MIGTPTCTKKIDHTHDEHEYIDRYAVHCLPYGSKSLMVKSHRVQLIVPICWIIGY